METLEFEPGRLGRRLEEVSVAGIRVNRAVYSAGAMTPVHAHPRADLCIPLEGGFEERWGSRREWFDNTRALLKPPGLEHVNHFGPTDVTCLNVEVSQEAWSELDGVRVDAPRVLSDPRLQQLGRELEIELSAQDRASNLAAQGLALSLFAMAVRLDLRESAAPPPSWLDDVRERLHAEFVSGVRLEELAIEAGVHPAHLTRRFRARFGRSVGEYVRQLRVAAALRGLSDLERPLAAVATDAGFSDQSHMGRVLRRVTGMTPGEWRSRMGRRGSDRSNRARGF